jgi:poly(A) polymerase
MTQVQGDWIRSTGAQTVTALLERAGFKALFVGGCVRNDLLGQPVSDLDLCTDARPDRVVQLAQAAGIRAVPTGIDHGTVTLVVGGEPFETTTFRRDVRTDGRHAEVVFAETVEEDAARRDFTMNALYADARGQIFDPLGNGIGDLEARHVRFIGDASARLREDYLRALRFFRFHAWYGDADSGPDAEAVAAIAGNLDGLARLSKERVGAEVLKLLAAPDPAPAVATMRQAGVLNAILPGADDRALAPLLCLEEGRAPDPIRRLAAIAMQAAPELRLSKAQDRKLDLLRKAVNDALSTGELGYRFGADTAVDVLLLRAALFEQPLPQDAVKQAETGATAKFPIAAKDLMPEFSGPELGAKLRALEAEWIASGFKKDREELLRRS